MQKKFFPYCHQELDYLKNKDKKLAEVIDKIGLIKHPVQPDLFQALMNVIVGQQISTKAHVSIWQKIESTLAVIDAKTLANCSVLDLQQCGLSFRKVEYMQAIARQVDNKTLDFSEFYQMSDEAVIQTLTQLRGIGVWSAEMLLIFSLQRPNVLSFGDLAIQRGLRMLYHHRQITPKLFQKYQRRYSPYATVASFYLWEIAGGAVADMKDYKPRTRQ